MAQETVAEQVRQARILAAKFKYSGGPEGRLAAWIVWLNDTLESRDAEVAELRARVDPQADSLRQKLWEYLGTETYLCDRDASAWGYGTMSLDDFRLAREDDEFMDSVLDLPDSPMKGDNR